MRTVRPRLTTSAAMGTSKPSTFCTPPAAFQRSGGETEIDSEPARVIVWVVDSADALLGPPAVLAMPILRGRGDTKEVDTCVRIDTEMYVCIYLAI